jgi:TM2 domain-containing membrane protein YozV
MAQLGGIPPSIFRNLPLIVQSELGGISVQNQAAFLQEYKRNAKSTGWAYFLWFFLGFHYIYLKKWGIQFIYWFTGAGFVIWAVVDLFRIPGMIRAFNQDVAANAIMTVKTIAGSGYYQRQEDPVPAAARPNEHDEPLYQGGADKTESDDAPSPQPKTQVESFPSLLSGFMEVLAGSQKGARIQLQGVTTSDGQEVTIGRIANNAHPQGHVAFSDPTVSRQQACLLFQNGQYSLINLSSTNPTRVNGDQLHLKERVYLSPGDRIQFGDVEVLFRY